MKITQWLKNLFHDEISLSSQIDEYVKSVKKDKDQYEKQILEWFTENGYTLISKDTRAFFYSYRVMKGTQLETTKEFTLREMIGIILAK